MLSLYFTHFYGALFSCMIFLVTLLSYSILLLSVLYKYADC